MSVKKVVFRMESCSIDNSSMRGLGSDISSFVMSLKTTGVRRLCDKSLMCLMNDVLHIY